MTINWLPDDSPHRDVIDIIERVQRSQMTPEEAEEWALKNECPPFVPALDAGSPAPVEEPYWPIPLAVAWIIAREPETAVRNWMRQKVWGRVLWRTSPGGTRRGADQDGESREFVCSGSLQEWDHPVQSPNDIQLDPECQANFSPQEL